MEKKCCICGNEFIENSRNAEPVRKGICCPRCDSRFVIVTRMLNWSGTFEIVKNQNELNNLEKKLEEKNFKQMSEFRSLKRFQNIETGENVIVCIINLII